MICTGCKEEKGDQFYTGHTRCKECVKARVRYLDNPERKANALECARRARADGRNREYQRRHKEKYPVERAARVKLGNAVMRGKIAKGTCAVCGSDKVHAHHHDYNKPLDVIWLCPTHHGETWRGPRSA
jgi:hypothetical protein